MFTSKDYTFCNNAQCKKSSNCMRHITHYPQYKDNALWMVKGCDLDLYIPIKDEGDDKRC